MSEGITISEHNLEALALNSPFHLLRLIRSDGLSYPSLILAIEATRIVENNSTEVVDALLPFLKHESPVVREATVSGLENRLEEPRVRPAMEELLMVETSKGVRMALKEALGGA